MSEHQTSAIHLLSTSTVKITPHAGSTARIDLTPSDLELLFLEYSQKGLLFLKPDRDQESRLLARTGSLSLIHHLQSTLQRTLQFFPPLAGRLAVADSTTFFIDLSDGGGGALFLHATAEDQNMTVADLLDASANSPDVIASLFPLTGVRNSDGGSAPLMAVQVTEVADGLFLGCSINHMLADGSSFWYLINSWAEVSRTGNLQISKLPLFNGDEVNLELTGSRTITIHHKDLIPSDEIKAPLGVRVFQFSRGNVAKLKLIANSEIEESKGRISSLQALIAHVWLSIMRCRLSINPGIQETTFEIPMGARQRVNPPLPDEYFGNAVFPGIVTLEARQILEKGLGWTGWQINKMVSSRKEAEVREFYRGWSKEPKFLQFDALPSNHFVLINSPRFNVYGNDFGWGKPVGSRTGMANSFDGRIAICGGGMGQGSIEIEACLSPQTLSALVEDPKFMEFVTSN